jgi:hypothetical protein
MAARFMVEHVATKPRGYRVRTVVKKSHRVRIAFPPGRRVPGSGQVLEVLHPLHENPCTLPNPQELLVLANPGAELLVLANPGEAEDATNSHGVRGATKVCEDFHGRGCDTIEHFQEPSPRSLTLGELAELLELRVERDAGWKWAKLDFTGRGVKMGANAAGTQIYFVQGDQEISRGRLTLLGVDNQKEMIDLGFCRYIAYRSDKPVTGGKNANYEHGFGEETNEYPRLMYDNRGSEPRLFLTGGAYRVEGLWIHN